MRRAREHTLKHEREDLASVRLGTPELDRDGESESEGVESEPIEFAEEPAELDERDGEVVDCGADSKK